VRLLAPRGVVWLLVVWLASRAYDAAAVHLFGSSIGRRVAGIEVRSETGEFPDRAAAVRRAFARPLSVLGFGGGLLRLRSDPRRQAWHDRVARTVVLRAGAGEPVDDTGDGGFMSATTSVPLDANEVAIRRAGLSAPQAAWVRAIAEQTAVRLDFANPSWRR